MSDDNTSPQTLLRGSEPVGYIFRLARSISHPGDPAYLNFDDEPRFSFTKPCVPEGSIKDLQALYVAATEDI